MRPARRFPLWLFLAIVFAVKAAVVLQLKDHPLLQPDSGLDTTAYVDLAGRIRAGDLLLGPGMYFVSPLYAYFLAAALAVFHSFTAVRFVQAALGTAAVAFVFVAGDEWFGRRAAWIAAALAAGTGVFTFFESLLLQSALDPVLTAASLAALAIGLNRRSSAFLLAAGALFGVHSLNRPNVVISAIVIVLLLLSTKRIKAASIVAAGLAVALSPAAARNAVVAGGWSPLPSQGGLNFYIGNNAEADGTYHSVPGVTPNIAGQQPDARSGDFYRRGLDWIHEHPRDAASLFVRKLAFVFNQAHIYLNDSFPFYAYDMDTLLRFLVVGPWLLVPLGVVGLLFARRVSVNRVGTRPTSGMLVWASYVPAYAISVALFFVADRYRVPLLIPLAVGAGAAIDALLVSIDVRAVAIAAPLFVLAVWPFHVDDGRAEERTRMAEHLIADGDYAGAENWTSRAEAAGANPALLHFRVARQLIAAHQPQAAVPHLERVLSAAPDDPEAELALGEALADAGRPADAIPHLRRARTAAAHADVAGFDLASALVATGDRQSANNVLRTLAPRHRTDASSWLALGDLAVRADDSEDARRFYEGAVAADASNPTALLNLAVACAQAGDLPAARRHAEAALRLKPDYEKAREFLEAIR